MIGKQPVAFHWVWVVAVAICFTGLGFKLGNADEANNKFNSDCGVEYCKWKIKYDNSIAGFIHNENYLNNERNKMYELIYSDLTLQQIRDSLEAMEPVADTIWFGDSIAIGSSL